MKWIDEWIKDRIRGDVRETLRSQGLKVTPRVDMKVDELLQVIIDDTGYARLALLAIKKGP